MPLPRYEIEQDIIAALHAAGPNGMLMRTLRTQLDLTASRLSPMISDMAERGIITTTGTTSDRRAFLSQPSKDAPEKNVLDASLPCRMDSNVIKYSPERARCDLNATTAPSNTITTAKLPGQRISPAELTRAQSLAALAIETYDQGEPDIAHHIAQKAIDRFRTALLGAIKRSTG